MVGLEWKHCIYFKRDRSNIKDVWCQLWGRFRICLRHLSVGTVSKIVAVLLGPQKFFPLCCLQHPEKGPPYDFPWDINDASEIRGRGSKWPITSLLFPPKTPLCLLNPGRLWGRLVTVYLWNCFSAGAPVLGGQSCTSHHCTLFPSVPFIRLLSLESSWEHAHLSQQRKTTGDSRDRLR